MNDEFTDKMRRQQKKMPAIRAASSISEAATSDIFTASVQLRQHIKRFNRHCFHGFMAGDCVVKH